MPASLEVILLERIGSLGNLGDRVFVKPGYARNYLLPQNKALRATKSNIAYFETRKKEIEKQNETNRKEAEKHAKALEGLTVTLVRLASESGQLYGSVTARDIAEAICSQSKEKVDRSQVEMNQTYKTIGLFPVTLTLHPEVQLEITVNIARSEEEAKTQAKTGKALVAETQQEQAAKLAAADEAAEEAKKKLLEEEALEAEKAEAEAKAVKEAEKAAKEEAKAVKKADAEVKTDEEIEAEAAEEENKE